MKLWPVDVLGVLRKFAPDDFLFIATLGRILAGSYSCYAWFSCFARMQSWARLFAALRCPLGLPILGRLLEIGARNGGGSPMDVMIRVDGHSSYTITGDSSLGYGMFVHTDLDLVLALSDVSIYIHMHDRLGLS